MRILFLAQHYWPEEVSGSVLATQLAESLAQRGHDVTFATCFPNYPQGVVFEGYRRRLFMREQKAGVAIIRAWSYTAPRDGAIKQRFIDYGVFSATVFFAAIAAQRPDVIMSYSPPFPLGLTALIVSRLRGVPWVLRIEDLFPDAAITAGVIRNRRAIQILQGMEQLFYRRAAHISVISESFRRRLLERGVPAGKLSVVPVWADPEEVRPMPRETAYRREHGWSDKFVLLYTGNLGYTSALDDVLAAASHLRDDNVQLVIVGEGPKKAELMQAAQDQANVTFLPFQPRERFAELLATADATLVTLNADNAGTSLPSKTFNYLACGRPILAVAPLESDLSRLLQEADCGLVVPPGKPEQLVQAIRSLKADTARQVQMGKCGRALLQTRFSREECVSQYESMLQRFTCARSLADRW